MGEALTFSGKSAGLGASLKCPCTNAYNVGHKWEEFEVCMQLQGCSFIEVSDVGYLAQLECCHG